MVERRSGPGTTHQRPGSAPGAPRARRTSLSHHVPLTLLVVLAVLVLGAASTQAETTSGSASTTETAQADTSGPASSSIEAVSLPMIESQAADLLELARLLEETGVDTSPPEETLRDWAADMSTRIKAWLLRLNPLDMATLSWIGNLAGWLAIILVVCGLVAIVIVVVRSVLAGRSPRMARPAEDEPAEEPATAQDPSYWLEQLEHELAAGRLNAALQALWSWLAAAIAGPDVDSSWTTGDLLRASRRSDLKEPLRRLDRLVYGADPVDAEAARAIAELLLQMEAPGGAR